MNFFWQLIIVAMCVSCHRPYNPTEFEKDIFENTWSNFDMISQINNKKLQEIHDVVWNEIDSEGNRPKDINLGRSMDSVFYPTMRCVKLIETYIQKIEQNKTSHITITEFKNLYDQVNEIKSEANLNFWIMMATKRNINTKNVSYSDLYTELFVGQNQKEALSLLKVDLVELYKTILEDFSMQVGNLCIGWGRNFEPILIFSAKNPSNNSFFDANLYMMAYDFYGNIQYRNYYLGDKKLSIYRGEGLINLPITDTIPGKKTFTIVSSFGYFNKEIRATTVGHYFVK